MGPPVSGIWVGDDSVGSEVGENPDSVLVDTESGSVSATSLELRRSAKARVCWRLAATPAPPTTVPRIHTARTRCAALPTRWRLRRQAAAVLHLSEAAGELLIGVR